MTVLQKMRKIIIIYKIFLKIKIIIEKDKIQKYPKYPKVSAKSQKHLSRSQEVGYTKNKNTQNLCVFLKKSQKYENQGI